MARTQYYDTDPAPDDFAGAAGVSDVHLWDYVRTVITRWPLAIAVFGGIVFLAAAYTWTRAPRYRAEAEILLERGQVDLSGLKDARDLDGAVRISQAEFVQTQVRLLQSTPVLESALQESGLILDPGYEDAADPVEKLRAELSVVPVRKTSLITVSVAREDGAQAANVVNAVVDAYEEQAVTRRLGVSDKGLTELRAKADELRIKLDAASSRLYNFMDINEMVSLEKAQNIVVARLIELNRKLAEVEPARLEQQSRLEAAEEAIQAGLPVDSIPEVLASQIIKTLKVDLSKLEQEYSQLLLRLGENHPQLQAVESQIDALRTKLGTESSAILSSLENEFKQALREEELLRTALRKQEAEVLNFNKLSAQYEMLQRSRDSVQGAYETIIRRIEEIDINRMSDQGKTSFVVSRAKKPSKPDWPKKGRNMLVALLLGGMLAVGICFFVDYMDTTIRDEEFVKRLLDCGIVGHVPRIAWNGPAGESRDAGLIVADEPLSHAAEAFRLLRTSLFYQTAREPMVEPPKSFVVSSTVPREGKSFVAANLAAASAMGGKKTLLIGGDTRRPSLKKIFPCDYSKGLADILGGGKGVSFEQAVQKTHIENLDILYAGTIPGSPVEMLDSESLGLVLREAESKYDLIVIDAPPAGGLSDAIVMGRRTFGILLVVRTFVTQRRALEHLADKLAESGVPVIAAVVNDVDVPKRAYHYYYSHYYYGAEEEPATAGKRIRKEADNAWRWTKKTSPKVWRWAKKISGDAIARIRSSASDT